MDVSVKQTGALLVYDITNVDSFTKMQNWVKELRKMLGKDIWYKEKVRRFSSKNIIVLLFLVL